MPFHPNPLVIIPLVSRIDEQITRPTIAKLFLETSIDKIYTVFSANPPADIQKRRSILQEASTTEMGLMYGSKTGTAAAAGTKVYTDDATGRRYQQNPLTGKTQWVREQNNSCTTTSEQKLTEDKKCEL